MVMNNVNLLPTFDEWTAGRDEVSNTLSVSEDGCSCSFTITNENSYIRYRIDSDNIKSFIGHELKLCIDSFTSTDNKPVVEIRFYDSNNEYTRIRLDYEDYLNVMPFEYSFTIPSECSRLDIRFGHDYAVEGIDPPATLTINGVSLIDTYIESTTYLNFHKVLQENLPPSVDAGTQHIYFTSDGATAKQYISDINGNIIPVVGYSESSDGYYNAYTQAHIDERKQEIVNLTRQGHCITFAVATDIHVRDAEDGDGGRYNQVRDFIMLSEQLPLDYIFCEGDIMSYCQEWDKVFEPRCDKVRKIFDKCRCPWFVVRGNHDFNEDDYGFESNPNIKQFTAENCADYFITDRDWHRTISSKMPTSVNIEYHFDELHPHNGYYYVDDYNNKHRMIFCNTEETIETDNGTPYINENGDFDATLASIVTRAQTEWILDYALDMTNKSDWVVSFHSHKVPYSDKYESDKSEFHGYGWYDDNGSIFRELINAFQNGTDYDFLMPTMDVDTRIWDNTSRTMNFSKQGAIKVLGWFGGHIHDDCYRKVNGINFHVSTCTCQSQRTKWANDPTPIKLPPERNSKELAMSVNVFVVNLDTRTINVIKVGSKRDNSIVTSSDLSFDY